MPPPRVHTHTTFPSLFRGICSVTMLEHTSTSVRDIATILLVNISVSQEGRELFTSMGFDALTDMALCKISGPPPTLNQRKRIVKIMHNMLHLTDPHSVPTVEVDSDDEDTACQSLDFVYYSTGGKKKKRPEGKDGQNDDETEVELADDETVGAIIGIGGGLVFDDPNSMEAMQARQNEAKALVSRCCRIAAANGVPTLMSLSRIEDPDCRLMCAVALSTLANTPQTHSQFVEAGGFTAMTEMAHYDRTDVGTSACWSIRLCCIRTAAYAARQPASRLRGVVDGACEMLVQAVQSSVFSSSIKRLCCQTIELFSRDRKARPFMAQQGIVQALDHLLQAAMNKQDSDEGTLDGGHGNKSRDTTMEEEAALFSRTVRNLSFSDPATEDVLVEYGVVHLFHSFAAISVEAVAVDCAIALCNVFQKTSHEAALINDHALQVIQVSLQ